MTYKNGKMVAALIMGCLFITVLSLSCGNNPQPAGGKTQKPNILIIVADDLGYSDIEPYGGNIETPNISMLSSEGIRFSSYYVLPTCSPTRSALLTGNDNHVAGLGIMSEMTTPTCGSNICLDMPGT